MQPHEPIKTSMNVNVGAFTERGQEGLKGFTPGKQSTRNREKIPEESKKTVTVLSSASKLDSEILQQSLVVLWA